MKIYRVVFRLLLWFLFGRLGCLPSPCDEVLRGLHSIHSLVAEQLQNMKDLGLSAISCQRKKLFTSYNIVKVIESFSTFLVRLWLDYLGIRICR